MKALSLTTQKLWPLQKIFADKQTDKWTDGQTDKQTGQLHAPDLSMWGHKSRESYSKESIWKNKN